MEIKQTHLNNGRNCVYVLLDYLYVRLLNLLVSRSHVAHAISLGLPVRGQGGADGYALAGRAGDG